MDRYINTHRRNEAIGPIDALEMAVNEETTKIHATQEAHLQQCFLTKRRSKQSKDNLKCPEPSGDEVSTPSVISVKQLKNLMESLYML